MWICTVIVSTNRFITKFSNNPLFYLTLCSFLFFFLWQFLTLENLFWLWIYVLFRWIRVSVVLLHRKFTVNFGSYFFLCGFDALFLFLCFDNCSIYFVGFVSMAMISFSHNISSLFRCRCKINLVGVLIDLCFFFFVFFWLNQFTDRVFYFRFELCSATAASACCWVVFVVFYLLLSMYKFQIRDYFLRYHPVFRRKRRE